ncbi:MAG TPA: hypothetical protein VN708_06240 [Terriglobales bacterium]|jgi:hypothetical protein|nr:hypothetical protein [Terriglobales bacterium]
MCLVSVEWIAKRLNVVQVGRIKFESWHIAGDQPGAWQHFASQEVEIKVVIFNKSGRKVNPFDIQTSVGREFKVESE